MAIRVRSTVFIAASALVLAGCGGGSSDEGVADLSAKKQLAAADRQLAKEEFITVKGEGTDEEAGKIAVDMAFAGKTVSGTVDVGGVSLEVLKADGKSYFKAGDFLKSSGAPEDVLAKIDGKWVVIDPANETFGEIEDFVSKKEFLDELLDPEGKVTKGKEKKVNGVDCVSLSSKEGTLYLDKSDGKPISIVMTGDDSGALDFSYDKIDEAEAPSADEVVDLAQLGA